MAGKLLRWTVVGILAGVLMSWALMVAPAASADRRVRIVSSLARSGGTEREAVDIERGVRMALEEADFRIGDIEVDYAALDDGAPGTRGASPRRETALARMAVADPSVVAYIGPLAASAAKSTIPILNAAGLAMVSPTHTYPGLTKSVPIARPGEPGIFYPTGVRNYARVVPTDDQQARIAASWAQKLGKHRFSVVDDGLPRGVLLTAVFVEEARALGLQIAGSVEHIDPEAAEYRELARRSFDGSVDCLYFAGADPATAARLLASLRSVFGKRPDVMTSDALYTQSFLDEAGSEAEGVYLTYNGLHPSNQSATAVVWAARFAERYDEQPSVYALRGYDVARLVLDAIRRANSTDREAIRAALFATRDFEGLLGRFSIDERGDTDLVVMSGRQVRDGRFDDEREVVLTLARPARAGS